MTEPKEVDWEKARHLAAVSSWAAQDIEAIATIIATAKAEERAAVVAWLRKVHHPCCHGCNDELASDIERGEHVKGGE